MIASCRKADLWHNSGIVVGTLPQQKSEAETFFRVRCLVISYQLLFACMFAGHIVVCTNLFCGVCFYSGLSSSIHADCMCQGCIFLCTICFCTKIQPVGRQHARKQTPDHTWQARVTYQTAKCGYIAFWNDRYRVRCCKSSLNDTNES